MEDSLPPYRFKVSLAFKHPSADLSGLSKLFGLEPFRQWHVGEPRTSPRGQPLDGTWKDSYWVAHLSPPDGASLEAFLSSTASWLSAHKSFFHQHSAAGGSAYLSVGFFITGLNAGILLDQQLLAQYASLGLALDFDCYSGGDEAGGAA